MITIQKEQNGNNLNIKMSGSFDESVDLFKLIGEPPFCGEMVVDCQGVKRQNSTGVKNWVKYFQYVNSKNTTVRFINCSTAIVDQFNLVANFGGGGKVESMFAPYSCVKCESELVALFKTEDIKRMQFKIPDGKCGKCSNKLVFDDIAEEYFAFMIKGLQ